MVTMVTKVATSEAVEEKKSNESQAQSDDDVLLQRSVSNTRQLSEATKVVQIDNERPAPHIVAASASAVALSPVLVPSIAVIVPETSDYHDPQTQSVQTRAPSVVLTAKLTDVASEIPPQTLDLQQWGNLELKKSNCALPLARPLSPSSELTKPPVVDSSQTLTGRSVPFLLTNSNRQMPSSMFEIGSKRMSSMEGACVQTRVDDAFAQASKPLTVGVAKESHTIRKENQSESSAGVENVIIPTMSSPDPSSDHLPAPTTPRTDSPGLGDALQIARHPLVGPYAPFIHSTDSSLEDARNRLRKALDQTRVLRAAFTDRVYEKYKVILRPVPACVDSIVDQIKADPMARKAQLIEEISVIKEEKELEKKEAQKLTGSGIFSGVSADGKRQSPSHASNAETADQLAYIGAGLNLVVLPEEDVQGHSIDFTKYQFRGPTNPETGHRVGGISAAAATAAETILDRVRRTSLLRSKRLHNQMNGPDTGGSFNESSNANDIILSRYQILPSITTDPSVSKVSDRANPQLAPKQVKRQMSSKSVASMSSSTKTGRSLSQPVVSVESILSMNPLAEDLDPTRRPSAATLALMACRVNSKSIQQRWQHPHPDSLGGRMTLSMNCKSIDAARYTLGVESLSEKALDAQPRSHNAKQAESRSPRVLDRRKDESDRARKALESILSQFVFSEDASSGEELEAGGEKIPSDGAILKMAEAKKNRRATEIGLLHGMQHAVESEGKVLPGVAILTTDCLGTTRTVPAPPSVCKASTDQDAIEPIVAFSVLQGLGLIDDTPISQRETSQPVWERIGQATDMIVSVHMPEAILPSSKFLTLHRKVTSMKRSFSEAFASRSSGVECLRKKVCTDNLPLAMPKSGSGADLDIHNMLIGIHGHRVVVETAIAVEELQLDQCHVQSIRGGGGDELHRPGSAPSNGSSKPSSSSSAAGRLAHGMRPSNSDGLFSTLAQNRLNNGSARMAFSPQHNAGFSLAATSAHQGVVNQLHAQAHQIQLQAAAMNRLAPVGALSNFFGAGMHQRQGFTNHAEWAALANSSQASVNLLQTHSSLTALGLNPHQAAMLELSARDRATRIMLAREQQASAVHAAAARQISAMRNGGSMSGLSSQQAAVLMGSQGSHPAADLFATSSASRFGHLSGHSAATAAAILSSSATAALIGQSQLSLATSPAHLGLSQNNDSRPSSGHSLTSTSTGRGQLSSASILKEVEEDLLHNAVGASSEEARIAPIGKPAATKRKFAELVAAVPKHQNDDDDDRMEEKQANELRDKPMITAEMFNADSPPRKKPVLTPDVAEKSVESGKDDTIGNPSKMPIDNVIDVSPVIKDDGPLPQAPTGMQFFVPQIPASLDPQMAACALDGRIHVALSTLFLPSGQLCSIVSATTFLDYILAVAAAVPIPKALVSTPLKERLYVQTLKISSSIRHVPSIPRDVVAAIVLVWLWVQHKDCFQRAFAKSGRIDVDPECKWLIKAAVDAASRALVTDLAEALHSGNATGIEPEMHASVSVAIDAKVALIVSEALMAELCIGEEIDIVLPIYRELVHLIDEMRLFALKAKCRERVFLAALIAQQATMSEAFADAYVSSMLRAGEALDHGNLFEMVQDEEASTSTMIPYDIFSDETRAWEDPCRPANGFTPNLTGEDLVRRAHARAMIIKSLRKLQDRNGIKGGTPGAGPYADTARQSDGRVTIEPKALQRTQSNSSKRRASFLLPEQSFRAGTGFGQATSISQYNPHHVSTPLFWDTGSIENMPYGLFSTVAKSRAPSLGNLDSLDDDAVERNLQSTTASSNRTFNEYGTTIGSLRRSTGEIAWADIANAFVTVDLGGGPALSRRRAPKVTSPSLHQPRSQAGKTIFAPFCNTIDDSMIVCGGESYSEEEDLSDEAILLRHQTVLDDMKARLDKLMEGCNMAGQRARQRAQARATET